MKKSFWAVCTSSTILAMAMASPALAQSGESEARASGQDKDESEIVVTGTQIRGIAPVGSNVVGVTSEDIQRSGINDGNQLLAQMPQSSFFLTLPEPGYGAIGAGTARVPVVRPNLRNLPLPGSGSGALTLVLMDGHRIVPMGIEQSVVDVGVLPTALLERTEVILDGASAVYGSDAVSGVLNFITRKRYDGLLVSARAGLAEDYWQVNASATVGKSWDTGGFSFSYEYAKNSHILNKDRSYTDPINWVRPRDSVTGVGSLVSPTNPPHIDGLQCDIPNVQDSAQNPTKTFHVSGTGLVTGPQFCDQTDFRTYTPEVRRHSLFAVYQQDLSDSIKFDVTALYTNRVTTQNEGPFRATVTVPPALQGTYATPALTTGNQSVFLSFGPALGNSTVSDTTRIEVWQITPTLSVDVGGGWQTRAQFGYGESSVQVERTQLETTILNNCLTAAGCASTTTGAGVNAAINPYNIAATDPAILNALDWLDISRGKNKFTTARLAADGPLFTLPGGDVKIALGGEWSRTTFTKRTTRQALPHNFLDPTTRSQDVKSAFAELVVPVFGPDNASPGLESLILSASGRFDDYGRIGNTFNPKLAATYKPVDWLAFRGNWGKSFRAPNATDLVNSVAGLGRCIGGGFLVPGCILNTFNIPDDVTLPSGAAYPCYSVNNVGRCTAGSVPSGYRGVSVSLTGGTNPNLKPEKSTSWSFGFDLSPPVIPGLTLSGTLWNINFKNIINLPQAGAGPDSLFNLFRYRPDLAIICRTSHTAVNQCDPGQPLNAAAKALASQGIGGLQAFNLTTAGGAGGTADLAYVVDTRLQNLASAKVRGIDASVTYRSSLGFGELDLRLNGTWVLKSQFQYSAGANFVDQLEFDNPTFRSTASAALTTGGLRSQVTWRHQDGYAVRPGLLNGRAPEQTHIRGVNVVDLTFTFDVGGDSLFTRDLQFQFNVNNLFDEEPPIARTTTGGVDSPGGVQSSGTFGRLFLFGVTKKF